MITKFSSIKNLAVFNNFAWESSVIDKEKGAIREFKAINIIYGRNYSGKTTLSRIVRALETGKISDKYENPDFTVCIKDGNDITPNNLNAHGKKFRVFNEDFVRENLKFINNPEENIESFAILGNDNAVIEEAIEDLQNLLGIGEPGKETGLFAQLKTSKTLFAQKKSVSDNTKKILDNQLDFKAVDRTLGIKYNADRYGDQNYSRPKLDKDIVTVSNTSFGIQPTEKYEAFGKLITEKINAPINATDLPNFQIANFNLQAKEILERKIGQAGKIEQLMKDAVLNKWVNEGRGLHKGKRQRCAFCNNEISATRWQELENHFDEEFERLEKGIGKLISIVSQEKSKLSSIRILPKERYYSKFHTKCDEIQAIFDHAMAKYTEELDGLIKQLEVRKGDPIASSVFKAAIDYSSRLISVFGDEEKLRILSNQYSTLLGSDQTKAKELLRLKEVYDFVKTIKYADSIASLKNQETSTNEENQNVLRISGEIKRIQNEIISKKRQLNDEEKGALKVNEYLNNFFGHDFLKLKAANQLDLEEQKSIRFEIIRDGKKAHHLSEGECSLIAFCYFMAKLEDVDTKGSKPIIWIDDPISSLDGNHIFFIYSLINTEIVAQNLSEQLFVSTHNLDFLKYLKRLPGAETTKETTTKYRYLVVQRHNKTSSILLMPYFLKEYITEFNFLFGQIHKCAGLLVVDDENHSAYYNFGNNARKFLEVFLYYKYPDSTSHTKKMLKFFGGESLPAVLTDRINNEYSHLCGVLERGGLPIEVPEMNATAKLILERIKILDSDQYDSLLMSIGALELPPEVATAV